MTSPAAQGGTPLFIASDPFAFFDYFRVPYEVRPSRQGKGHAGAAAFVRTLTAAARPGQASRSLIVTLRRAHS